MQQQQQPRSSIIVGISGFARVGKDTAKDVLVAEGLQPVAFADKVRRFAERLNVFFPEVGKRYNEIIAEHGYDQAKVMYPCIRKHLIDIGAGGRDVIHPLIWITAVKDEVAGKSVVFSDVRYANEDEMIHSLGGVILRVTRPGVSAVDPTEAESVAKVRFDYELINAGTIDEFRAAVRDWVQSMIDKHQNKKAADQCGLKTKLVDTL